MWSVDIKARLHYRPVHQLAEATHVKVVPHAFVGTRAIVPMHGKVTVSESAGGEISARLANRQGQVAF